MHRDPHNTAPWGHLNKLPFLVKQLFVELPWNIEYSVLNIGSIRSLGWDDLTLRIQHHQAGTGVSLI